jgi:phosphoglycerate kinase
MDVSLDVGFRGMDYYDYKNKRVLVRLDINSTIDQTSKKILSDNRIDKSLPTIEYLIKEEAKVVIIAHQGDTLDNKNLISMEEHAAKLSEKLGRTVAYIDDVAGPAAQEAIKGLKAGEIILLGNLRYLAEEISTFENAVKLQPEEMLQTYLVRNLAPLLDYYVNDAFSAAHRNAPSMVAFQELLPTASGILMMEEMTALTKLMQSPARPNIFLLGGAKISDAFGMMKEVLENGSADKILTAGVTGIIMLMAMDKDLGEANRRFIRDRNLDLFIEPARAYLKEYPTKFMYPIDLAYEKDGKRFECLIEDLPIENLPIEASFLDIGRETIKEYQDMLLNAGTIFVNGPAGVYENPLFEKATKELWETIAKAKGYSVIGGGDTVTAAQKYIRLKDISYVCTAGGAMVQYLSGKELPLIKAMKKARKKTI